MPRDAFGMHVPTSLCAQTPAVIRVEGNELGNSCTTQSSAKLSSALNNGVEALAKFEPASPWAHPAANYPPGTNKGGQDWVSRWSDSKVPSELSPCAHLQLKPT